MEYLRSILTVPCCHVTGMHDPLHYVEGRYVCQGQKADAFDNAIEQLGIPLKVKSKEGCYWCFESYKKIDIQPKQKDENESHDNRATSADAPREGARHDATTEREGHT